jgi:hypothetical protein
MNRIASVSAGENVSIDPFVPKHLFNQVVWANILFRCPRVGDDPPGLSGRKGPLEVKD